MKQGIKSTYLNYGGDIQHSCTQSVRGLFGDREDTEGQLVHSDTGRPRLPTQLQHITTERFVREQVKVMLN